MRAVRGGDLLGPFEQLWHPEAHRARIEIHAQDERQEEAPAPGDPLRARIDDPGT